MLRGIYVGADVLALLPTAVNIDKSIRISFDDARKLKLCLGEDDFCSDCSVLAG